MGIFAKIVGALKKNKERPFFQVESIGKVISEAELLQPYGFKSIAINNSKCYIQKINPNFEVIIAFEDLQEIDLKAGETAIYSTDDNGEIKATIKLLKDNSIDIITDTMNIDGKTISMQADKIKLNGDSLGGLIEVNKLRTELAKNNDILQTILTVCDIPVNEPGNGSPSAFQQALNLALTGKTVGDFSNITNDTVVHGK